MSNKEESISDLRIKYKELAEQLDLVNVELKNDPDNKVLVDLKTELMELIGMTSNLLEIKIKKEDEKKKKKELEVSSSSNSESDSNNSLGDLSQQLIGELEGGGNNNNNNNLINNTNTNTNNNNNNNKNDKIDLKYVTNGTECMAIYSGDGKLYRAVINRVDLVNKSCYVTYPDYGNSEEVLYENIYFNENNKGSSKNKRKRPEALNQELTQNNNNNNNNDNKNTVLVIPEHLKIKEDDSLEVKQQKKKKQKRLKALKRKKDLEQITYKKQNAWQSFRSKKRSKNSMFASPDSANGKVGVVGSGKGTTKFRERSVAYKKTKLSHLPSF
eukprot:TRINITY_DN481_c0_g7_i1.p1 TRINITY_DN481_c0_g7~~TRINITY_DN481_c0_g7_i1.p1  ORF type:complete len:328 (+),score=122.02 TRINITY_DN481_c0_g7_i1:71-1054(+)